MTRPFRTLIQTEELAEHLGDPAWVIVDCRFTLSDPEAGIDAWRRSRLPRAHYLHLEDDLAGPVTEFSGRHPLPDPERLVARLAQCGITQQSQVVAYDDSFGSIAGRLWWMLRWLGHNAVALLDGGFQKWRRERREMEAGHPGAGGTPGTLIARPLRSAWVGAAEVERALARRDTLLIDARAPERYTGEEEPFDPVAGHIPGARNRPFEDNLDIDGTFLSAAELREAFEPLLAGMPPRQAIHVCGSGVTACHNLIAMEIAGLGGSRLYPGSWSEWITDPRHPIAVGDAA
ncbi:MAG TPA: sulfurtransferase [Burkholderiales bacterium]|nr:sulfurtransferase [Burkholderiales bacterium]